MPTRHEELPAGWTRLQGNRPAYRRKDGYIVKYDDRATWGIRAPRENQPFKKLPDMKEALAYVDEHWPLNRSAQSDTTQQQ